MEAWARVAHSTRGWTIMAYGVVHKFPGGTKEQYEASIAAVHDSKESWERFRDGTLMPRMQAGIEGGFPTPPEESTFEVYKILP